MNLPSQNVCEAWSHLEKGYVNGHCYKTCNYMIFLVKMYVKCGLVLKRKKISEMAFL